MEITKEQLALMLRTMAKDYESMREAFFNKNGSSPSIEAALKAAESVIGF